MPIKIVAYKCDWCGFYRKTKKAIENHEKRCFWNPVRRACASCKNNETSTDYDEIRFWCSAFEVDLEKNLKYDCERWVQK
jgi:hypothetical protein